MKWLRMLLRLGLTLLLLVAGSIMPASTSAQAQGPRRPNIIFILADDLDGGALGTFEHLPRLRSLLTERGTTFSNAFVSLSLCCPSRASILRGQYAHNTEIFTNTPPGGGFLKAYQLGLESSTAATWLHEAGYRTVLLGKYLNGYPHAEAGGATYIPPGWDEWYSPVSGDPYSEFNYRLNENGSIVAYGRAPEDYMVDVLAHKAAAFIGRTTEKPFFMYLAPYVPHGPATPAPRYADAFPGAAAPRTSSFNETDVSDKPAWVQSRPRLSGNQIGQLDSLYRKRLQSMLAVEDLLEELISTLERTGQLENTYIFFTSDNGFHMGQHRLMSGKNTAFDEDLRVPLIVRGPEVLAGRVVEQFALNIDFAPTFAELAGATPPDFVDGRSLVPLLRRTLPASGWRQAFLMEHGFLEGFSGPANRAGRAVQGLRAGRQAEPAPEEPLDAFDEVVAAQPVQPAQPVQQPPPFQGIRTVDKKYVEYQETGERELYDLSKDPSELQNLGATGADYAVQLAAWLNALRDCAGAGCRAAEEAPPTVDLSRPSGARLGGSAR